MKKNCTLALLFALGILLFQCADKPAPTHQATDSSEEFRPGLHFTPDSNWMNDPNGLVYYAGQYHLYYQHYPDSNVWGPMHWGHAVSTDLMHWKRMPIALYPDSLGYIFSGSIVIDEFNTSGFGSEKQPPLVAIFTHHDPITEQQGSQTFQYQSLAYSLDSGRTWTKYSGNPVLPNPGIRDFRDPKVFYHAPTKKWLMTLAVLDHIEFYSSPDLKSWTRESTFGRDRGAHGGVWECPDLFPLTVPGTTQQKWVLLVSINPGAPNGGSGTQYFLGDFNGHEFTPDETDTLFLDYGKDNYAGVTYFQSLGSNQPRLFIGWMSNWQYATKVPTTRWRSATTLPRELFLHNSEAGLRLASKPWKLLKSLRRDSSEWMLTDGKEVQLPAGPVELTWSVDAGPWELTFFNADSSKLQVGVDADNRLYVDRTLTPGDFSDQFSGRHYAPRPKGSGATQVQLFLDRTSVEIFTDNGATVMTEIFFTPQPFQALRHSAGAKSAKGILYALESIQIK